RQAFLPFTVDLASMLGTEIDLLDGNSSWFQQHAVTAEFRPEAGLRYGASLAYGGRHDYEGHALHLVGLSVSALRARARTQIEGQLGSSLSFTQAGFSDVSATAAGR